jgi:hypothetical protein
VPESDGRADLALAAQPDSWGERTRARLISYILADLRGRPVETVGVEEIARVSNLVVPCFLLELGRRKQHIEIEFPENPCDSSARVEFRAGPSRPRYSIDSDQLLRLVAKPARNWLFSAISETNLAVNTSKHI